MRARSTPRSVWRAAAWVYFGPFVAAAGLALVAFGLGAFAVVIQLLAALLRQAGI